MSQEKARYIHTVLNELSSLIEIPTGLEERLIQYARMNHFSKTSYLEYPGDTDDGHIWYMVRGVARSVVFDQQTEKAYTVHLWKKGDILLNTDSFLNNSLRKEAIQLLDDSVLLGLSYSQLRQILSEWPALGHLIHLLAGKEKFTLLKYAILLRYPAVDRVRMLLLHFPGIQHRVSQTYLANYLAMDRSTFSSLLNKIEVRQ